MPTVDLEFFIVFLLSIHIDGGIPSSEITSGFSILSRNCLAYVDNDSRYLLLLSACIVSIARDDLPEPDNPVTTHKLYQGILHLIFFKLFDDAPSIEISFCIQI